MRSVLHPRSHLIAAVHETNVDDLFIAEFAHIEVRRELFSMEGEIGRGEFGVVLSARVSRAGGTCDVM